MHGAIRSYLRWAIPSSLVVIWVAMAFVPAVSSPAVALGVGMLLAVPLAVAALLGGSSLSGDVVRPLIVAAAPVAILGVSALLAINTPVSLAGMWGARTGWVTWAVALIWLWLAAVTMTEEGFKPLLFAVALLGVGSVALAIADALGFFEGGTNWSDKPAGVFEASMSLGQFLVLALGASIALLAGAATRRERVTALAFVVVTAAGVVVSESRGALVGVLVAVLVTLAVRPPRRPNPEAVRRAALIGLTVVALLLLAALIGAVVAPSAPLVVSADVAMSERLTIWRSAVLAWAADPFLGRGPAQFSAYHGWGVSGGSATTDPHSVVLFFLVSGGLAGLGAAIWAAVELGRVAVRRVHADAVDAWLFIALSGWLVSFLFSWVNSFCLIVAAVMTGALIVRGGASGKSRIEDRRPVVALAGASIAVAVACALVSAAPLTYEVRWGASVAESYEDRRQLALEIVRETRDPSYAAWVIAERPAPTSAQEDAIGLREALSLAERHAADSAWYTYFAFWDISARFAGHAAGLGTIEAAEAAISRARLADRGTGFFEYMATDWYLQLGMADRAVRHAREALSFPQSPETRVILEQVVAGERFDVP